MDGEYGAWLAAGLLLLVVAQGALLLSRRTGLKKWLHPLLLVAMGLLVVGFAHTHSPAAALIFTPLMALWVGMRLWMVRFCQTCGATNRRRLPFDDLTHCDKCGAAL